MLRIAILVHCSVLSSTLLIPAVRPFMAMHSAGDGAMHAFMSVNMLGAIVGAPLLAWLADRSGRRAGLLVALAVLDGGLLLATTLPLGVGWVLALRGLQGAANVGGLSILMGATRSRDPKEHGRAMGIAAAAVMAAVALGAPLGTLLLSLGPAAPIVAGGLMQLLVAIDLFARPLQAPPARRRARSPFTMLRRERLLRLPTLWVAAERFAVGSFVVSFALYGHRVLDLSDAEVGILFSWFLLPFALSTYPMARVAERLPRAALVGGGLGGYGLSFVLLGLASPPLLPAVMFVAGLASAAIYAPSLCYASALAPAEERSTSMAMMNAGGSLGMLLGTALAGILSVSLARAGWELGLVYPAIFALAGGVQLLTLAISARGLIALHRAERRGALGVHEPCPERSGVEPFETLARP